MIQTVQEALVELRAAYAALLEDLARGDRVLWIGSGISRDQVPGLEPLLRRVLTFLSEQIASNSPNDVHRQALESIITQHLPEELEEFAEDPMKWSVPDDLSHLTNSYSEILATEVGTEAQDYLLWEAVDLRETYGNPNIMPGPEHMLIAFLSHEGLLREAVTTNWDGLIELAVRNSSLEPQPEKISVLMSQESFRTGRARFKLYKAHGCAVLARSDASNRDYLVAQTYDFNTWRDNPIFTSLVEKLRELAKNRESLMVGTSFQDPDLLGRIASATQDLVWTWKPEDPVCVFAEPVITATHRETLKLVYRDDYVPNRNEICERSAAGMFSGLLLAAATLHLVMEKFRVGLSYSPEFAGSGSVLEALESGILAIEDLLAAESGSSAYEVVTFLRNGISSLVQRFFEPVTDLGEFQYKPVYDGPVKPSVDAQFRHLGIPQLSVALALLGLGMVRHHWRLAVGTGGGDSTAGTLDLTPLSAAGATGSRLIVSRDWKETSELKSTELWASEPHDVLVVQALGDRPVVQTRGPGGGLGAARRRSLRPGRRVTWLSELAPHAGDIDELVDAFRAELSA